MTKTKNRKIRITMRPYADIMEDVITTCERIENGLPVEPQDRELNFTNAANLLSTLSEKRMELLIFLHEHGPLNIRQLAKRLERDYSNVHTDVTLLLKLDLLALDEEKRVFVPWDELAIELPLDTRLKRAAETPRRALHKLELPPSDQARLKARQLIAQGLKEALNSPPATSEQVWAQFDAARAQIQDELASQHLNNADEGSG